MKNCTLDTKYNTSAMCAHQMYGNDHICVCEDACDFKEETHNIVVSITVPKRKTTDKEYLVKLIKDAIELVDSDYIETVTVS